MPTITRPLGTDVPNAPATEFDAKRPDGDAMSGTAALLPEDLLPSGGIDHGVPPAWALDAAFRGEVEAIRLQLAPIHDRGSLAASFGREAGHRAMDGRRLAAAPVGGRLTPLQFAYAIRWLELGLAPTRPTWTDLFDGPFE